MQSEVLVSATAPARVPTPARPPRPRFEAHCWSEVWDEYQQKYLDCYPDEVRGWAAGWAVVRCCPAMPDVQAQGKGRGSAPQQKCPRIRTGLRRPPHRLSVCAPPRPHHSLRSTTSPRCWAACTSWGTRCCAAEARWPPCRRWIGRRWWTGTPRPTGARAPWGALALALALELALQLALPPVEHEQSRDCVCWRPGAGPCSAATRPLAWRRPSSLAQAGGHHPRAAPAPPLLPGALQRLPGPGRGAAPVCAVAGRADQQVRRPRPPMPRSHMPWPRCPPLEPAQACMHAAPALPSHSQHPLARALKTTNLQESGVRGGGAAGGVRGAEPAVLPDGPQVPSRHRGGGPQPVHRLRQRAGPAGAGVPEWRHRCSGSSGGGGGGCRRVSTAEAPRRTPAQLTSCPFLISTPILFCSLQMHCLMLLHLSIRLQVDPSTSGNFGCRGGPLGVGAAASPAGVVITQHRRRPPSADPAAAQPGLRAGCRPRPTTRRPPPRACRAARRRSSSARSGPWPGRPPSPRSPGLAAAQCRPQPAAPGLCRRQRPTLQAGWRRRQQRGGRVGRLVNPAILGLLRGLGSLEQHAEVPTHTLRLTVGAAARVACAESGGRGRHALSTRTALPHGVSSTASHQWQVRGRGGSMRRRRGGGGAGGTFMCGSACRNTSSTCLIALTDLHLHSTASPPLHKHPTSRGTLALAAAVRRAAMTSAPAASEAPALKW